MDKNDWLEEARQKAASKRGARQLRFLAPGDKPPDQREGDEEIVTVPVGTTIEGEVVDLTEVVTKFGPTISATVQDTEYGAVKILAGPKLLADLFAVAQVGDFVSMTWIGKVPTKDGSTEYRKWDVMHLPAPGSTPKPKPVPVPAAADQAVEDDDDDL